ncbi:MAG: exo-alpha-sialidase [Ruminiclostridium sp.]|nr:exo-alpha-sialidase [Ruminiclostridium sp.]
MKPKLTGNGLVYGGRLPDRKSCCLPRLCVSGSRWLCVFRSAFSKEQSRGQETLLTWSDNEGMSWTEPEAPFKPLVSDGKPGVFREAGITAGKTGELIAALWWVDYSDPCLPLFNWKTEGMLESKLFISKSYDSGETWATPQHVSTSPFMKSTPLAGHVIISGNKLAYPFEQYKTYDEEGDWLHYSAMMLSNDMGITWDSHCITAHDPEGRMFYWDQRPCSLASGEIFVVFDTFEKGANTRPNIHAGISSNKLQDWSGLWDTGVSGQPGYPLELPDGRISLIYNDRGQNSGIKLRFSCDGGKTFPESTCFLVYSPQITPNKFIQRVNLEDVMAELNQTAVFGYPCQRLLPNGDILVTYYAGDTADTTKIWWARISP